MNPLQFNLDEDLDYSPILPEEIDISSESGEEITVEPGNSAQLNEKLSINTMGSNIMTAFVGSATASLFPPPMVLISRSLSILQGPTSKEKLWN